MDAEELAQWCVDTLGSSPRTRLFESRHVSVVTGLELTDGRRVVIRVRRHEDRLFACLAAQRALVASGFPCPMPLSDLDVVKGMAVSAEEFREPGHFLPRDQQMAGLSARLLARLVGLAPSPDSIGSLAPAPPWVGWGHTEGGLWPTPDDVDADLNVTSGPPWIDDAARRVRARLLAADLPLLVGHGDWWQANVTWNGVLPAVVYDWDSLVALPDAMIAGAAATVFVADSGTDSVTIAEADDFLTQYEAARGRAWTAEERQLAWAAGTWPLAFNARKEAVTYRDGPLQTSFQSLMEPLLERAGVATAGRPFGL